MLNFSGSRNWFQRIYSFWEIYFVVELILGDRVGEELKKASILSTSRNWGGIEGAYVDEKSIPALKNNIIWDMAEC